jgi:hypothetical protein
METIMSIFNQIASEIGLYNKQLIEIMLLRLERNIEEHEVLRQYMEQCNKSRIKVEFRGLTNYLHLNDFFRVWRMVDIHG